MKALNWFSQIDRSSQRMETTTTQQPSKKARVFWPACQKYTLLTVKAIAKSLFTWSWSKSLLYWLIVSGGTMAELAFLIGSIWMSLNATVHPFILMFVSEAETRYLSFLATSAYVALPELIMPLAVVITINHIRVYIYNRKNWNELVWTVLYGIPSVFFVGLSAYTIGESVASIGFIMPEPLVIIRALAGYLFASTSLLYWQLGKPQEVERLRKKDEEREALKKEKDGTISELQAETARLTDLLASETARLTGLLQSETARLTALITEQNGIMARQKKQNEELVNTVNKSADDALEAYSDECKKWLRSGVKTVSVDDINQFTGHSKRKIHGAIDAGKLQTASRNKELIMVSSLVEWLKINLPTSTRTEQHTEPLLRIVNE